MLLQCLLHVAKASNGAKQEADAEVCKIGGSIRQEEVGIADRFKEGERKVDLSVGKPLLMCEVNVVCKAEIPGDHQHQNGDDDGDHDAANALALGKKGIALDGADYTDKSADGGQEADLIEDVVKDASDKGEQKCANDAEQDIFLRLFGCVLGVNVKMLLIHGNTLL